MILSKKLIDQLVRDEGFRSSPYRCTAGKLTIGIGRNLEDKGISESEAMSLLQNDLQECYNLLADSFSWFERLSIIRASVVLNMVYNLGFPGFCKFKKTIAAFAKEDFSVAAMEMLDSKWAGQVGVRAVRLSQQLKTGEWV